MSLIKRVYSDNNLLQWLVIISIPLFRVETIMMLIILMTTKWRGVSVYLRIALILLVHAILMALILGYTLQKPLMQILLLGIHGIGYYTFFRTKVTDVDEVWSKYLVFCEIVGVIGIIQAFIMLTAHVDIFYFINSVERDLNPDNSIRIHAIFGEAGYLAAFLIPYIIYSIINFRFIDKKKFFVTFSVFIATFSAAAYAVLFLFFIYRFISSKYKALAILIVPFLLLWTMTAIGDSSDKQEVNAFTDPIRKIDDSFKAFSSMNPYDFELLNASSYATMTNLWVACNAPFRLVGTGIGTHEQSYVRLYKSNFELYGLCKEDAYSMANRLFSENGLIGIVFAIFLIKRGYNKRNKINVSILFFIIAIMMRGGHYTLNGIFFFCMIYYFTSKVYLRKQGKYVTS